MTGACGSGRRCGRRARSPGSQTACCAGQNRLSLAEAMVTGIVKQSNTLVHERASACRS
jgi:hypothetical protein